MEKKTAAKELQCNNQKITIKIKDNLGSWLGVKKGEVYQADYMLGMYDAFYRIKKNNRAVDIPYWAAKQQLI